MPSRQVGEALRPSVSCPPPVSNDPPADELSPVVLGTLEAFRIAGQFSSWKVLVECIQRKYLDGSQADGTDAIPERSLLSDQETGALPIAESRDHNSHASDSDDVDNVHKADKACHPSCVQLNG